MEVRGRQHPPVGEDHGAIGGPRELDLDFPPSLFERVQRESDDLRQTAEGERILNAPGGSVAKGTVVEQAAEERRGVLLPRRRAQSHDLRVEDRDVGGEPPAGERGRVSREEHEAPCVGQRERRMSDGHRARAA